MSDFCLSPHAMAGIARQAGLMDRMALRAGIGPSSTARSGDPALWYEARLKCIGCAMSLHCTVSRIAQTSRADASPGLLRQPNVLWRSRPAVQQFGVGRSK